MNVDQGQDLKLQQYLNDCSSGQHMALKHLYSLSSANLFSVALRILKDRSQAEDCLQSAYIKIWNNAGTYSRDKARPMTWMSTIVRNQALDMLRKKRPEEISGDEHFSQIVDDSPGQEQYIDQLRNGRQVHRCLAGLSDQQRVCIEMAYFDGFTHQELAEQMDKPLGSVKTWIRRGLLRLRECLSGI